MKILNYIICKICNPTLTGNGYCGFHSTSGTGYAENQMDANEIEKENKEWRNEFLKKFGKFLIYPLQIELQDFIKKVLSQREKELKDEYEKLFDEMVQKISPH